eukprot:scaffold8374_cov175-Amphora_coffeaeformis.AAC.37
MADTQTELPSAADASPPPVPLKTNRRSLIPRLFGRKKNKTAEGEVATGKVKGAAPTGKKWNKKTHQWVPKTPEAPVGEEREPEAPKSPAAKPEEEKPVAPEKISEETKETPESTSKPIVEENPAEKVAPETVDSESETEEESKTTESATEKQATEDDKAEKAVDAEKKEDEKLKESEKEEPASEDAKTAEMQAGDDSSRDPPMTEQLKAAALFCGCI